MGRHAGVRKRGRRWYVYYRAAGRQIEEPTDCATAADAAEYRRLRLQQLDRNDWRPRGEAEELQVGSARTVAELLDWYRTHEVPKLRGQSFALETLHVVEREFGPLPVRHLGPERVERWLARLRAAGCGPSTIRKYGGRLRRVWRAAAASPSGRRLLAGAPCPVDGVPLPREPQGRRLPVPADAVPRLLAAADQGPVYLGRWVRLCLFLGLRVHEARRLTGAQLDLARGVAFPDGKTGVRAVPIPADLLDDVKAWAADAGDSPVIGTTLPRPPFRVVRTMLRRAGLEGTGLSMRSLRTTFVRAGRSAGVELAALADVAGHDVETLRRWYADADLEERRAAVERAGARIAGRALAEKPEGGGKR